MQELLDLLSVEHALSSVKLALHGGNNMAQDGAMTLHDDSLPPSEFESPDRTLEEAGVKHGDIVEAMAVDKYVEQAPAPLQDIPNAPIPPTQGQEPSPPPQPPGHDVEESFKEVSERRRLV